MAALARASFRSLMYSGLLLLKPPSPTQAVVAASARARAKARRIGMRLLAGCLPRHLLAHDALPVSVVAEHGLQARALLLDTRQLDLGGLRAEPAFFGMQESEHVAEGAVLVGQVGHAVPGHGPGLLRQRMSGVRDLELLAVFQREHGGREVLQHDCALGVVRGLVAIREALLVDGGEALLVGAPEALLDAGRALDVRDPG